MDKDILLEVKDLSVSFKTDRKHILDAVRHVSFTVRKGETLGIVGESGCGKSVTAMSVLRLNPASRTVYPSGEIMYGDEDLLRISDDRLREIRGNEIAFIFQEPMTALDPLFSIGDQLMEAIRIHDKKTEKSEAYRRSAEALDSVRIPNPERIMGSYPFQLSGGMLQRVMIAMAMISKPKLLICDEPTTALDVTIQAQVLELMNDLKKENETSIVFITHDLGVISQMADRVMVMYGGRVCETALKEELFERPAHPYTKGLIDSYPNPDYKGKRLKTIPGSVPPLSSMPAGCPFHNRCAEAKELCREQFPGTVMTGNDHFTACHLFGKEAADEDR